MEGILVLGEVQADVVLDRLVEEIRSRRGCQANLPHHPGTEIKIVAESEGRYIYQNVICALWIDEIQTSIAQIAKKKVASGGIFSQHLLVVTPRKLQSSYAGFLQRRRSAHGEKIMNFAQPGADRWWSNRPANPLARHRVGF